ncbi:MAG TPA: YkgJ family cysteine cluster protein [Bacteroidia bacterium]|nr:YkgJ family cysteine cluster protein [Bacteroidia bacterium]
MSGLNQDREYVKSRALLVHEENQRFRKFLLRYSVDETDALFTQLHRSVAAAVDCTLCAACCASLEPELQPSELDKIRARAEKSEVSPLVSVQDSNGQTRHFLKSPCFFLCANRCSIYEEKPVACSSYPHLEEPGIRYRLRTVFEQAHLCPIVFHVLELMKRQTQFITTPYSENS